MHISHKINQFFIYAEPFSVDTISFSVINSCRYGLAAFTPRLFHEHILSDIIKIESISKKTNIYSRSCHQRPCFCQTKKSLVTDTRWSQECVFAVKFAGAAVGLMSGQWWRYFPPLTGSHCGSKHAVVATFQCLFWSHWLGWCFFRMAASLR